MLQTVSSLFVNPVFGVQPSLDQEKEICTVQSLVQFVQATIFLYFLLQVMMLTSWMLGPKLDWRSNFQEQIIFRPIFFLPYYLDWQGQGMPNKRSCRTCGDVLTPTAVCNICKEYIRWLCRKCYRIEDVTHAHTFPNVEPSWAGLMLLRLY